MTDDLIDTVSKALRRAWQLGQTYWQQADSESWTQQAKSDETQKKFEALVDETRALLSASKPAAPEGWKLVPIEPTVGMPVAGGLVPRGEHLFHHPRGDNERVEVIGFGKACEVWGAMLAASPAAPNDFHVADEKVAAPAQLNDDARAAVDFYAANPSAALLDFQKRFAAAPAQSEGAVSDAGTPTLWEAFEMGFGLRSAMLGHVLDGRDVGRLTTCEFWHPSMLNMHEGNDLHIGLSVSEAIVKVKNEVRRRLDAFDVAHAAQSPMVLDDERAAESPKETMERLTRQFNQMSDLECAVIGDFIARAASPQATCQTCNGHGMIGGPSYREPDEGGEPCPDCATATQPAQRDQSGNDALFARVTDWMNTHHIPFEAQNELFRILAASPQPIAQMGRALTFAPLYKKLMRGDVDVCEAYLRLKVVGSCPTQEEFCAALEALLITGDKMDDLESLYEQLDAYAGVIRNRDARIVDLESQLAAKTELATLYAASLRKAEAEVDGLRVDARRYRFLRDFGEDGVNIKPPCEHVHATIYSHPVGSIPATRVATGAELDRAIDAALSAATGERKP